jgi:hypothetical protein
VRRTVYSQEAGTTHYLKQDESISPCHGISLRSILILSSYLHTYKYSKLLSSYEVKVYELNIVEKKYDPFHRQRNMIHFTDIGAKYKILSSSYIVGVCE